MKQLINDFILVESHDDNGIFISNPTITHISISAITAFGKNWVKISKDEYTEKFLINEKTYQYLLNYVELKIKQE